MPVYEYQCRQCGWKFEALVPSASAKAPECPVCRSPETEKKISSFAVGGKQSHSSCPHAGTCSSASDGCASGHACGCGCGCHGH